MTFTQFADRINKLQTGLMFVREMRRAQGTPGVAEVLDQKQAELEKDFNDLHKEWLETMSSGKDVKEMPHGKILKQG